MFQANKQRATIQRPSSGRLMTRLNIGLSRVHRLMQVVRTKLIRVKIEPART